MTVKSCDQRIWQNRKSGFTSQFRVRTSAKKNQIVAINDLASLKQMLTLLSLIVRTDVLVRQSMFLKMQFK